LSFWTERPVTLRLNSAGKVALAGLLEGEDVDVFVQWADELGLWILQDQSNTDEISVALVRWGHFETALTNVVLSYPEPTKVIGFKTWQSGKRN